MPCHRSINVTLRGGKKVPVDEKNNMVPTEIAANRGQAQGNTVSFYVKHVPDMFVIDFDQKDLQDCELKRILDANNVAWVETRKGYHYYLYIRNMIDFTQQQKIYVDPSIEVDLLKKNNVWEAKERCVQGAIGDFEWTDLKHLFDVAKMTGEHQKQAMITVSTTEYYSRERNERRTLEQCVEAAQSGLHWQESFQTPDQKLKLFVDIDHEFGIDEFTEESFDVKKQEFLHNLPREICGKASISINERHIALSESCGRKRKGTTEVWSLSAHVVVLGYCAKQKHMLGVLQDLGIASVSGFDVQVYQGKHMFRMIGNYKQKQADKPVDRRRLMPVTYKDDWTKHIIQYVTNEAMLTSQRTISSTVANGCAAPAEYRQFLESKGMIIKGNAIRTESGGLCIKVKAHCPFAGRVHESNLQHVTFRGATKPVMKCYDDDCRNQKKELEGWNPIPPTMQPDTITDGEDTTEDSSVQPSETDEHISQLINAWILSKLDDASNRDTEVNRIIHHVTGPVREGGIDIYEITNSAGLCYAAAVKGQYHRHSNTAKVKLRLSKASDEAICEGSHENVKLRGKDS
eukprot:SAG25_NODE_685_length_5933_cov_20.891841_1_plen_572_part_10